MAETFDAKFEAQSVERIGYTLLHDGENSCWGPLTEKLGELNPEQVKALGNQLAWDNYKPNDLPSVKMTVSEDGHITGFSFRPSWLDHSASASCVAIRIGPADCMENPVL